MDGPLRGRPAEQARAYSRAGRCTDYSFRCAVASAGLRRADPRQAFLLERGSELSLPAACSDRAGTEPGRSFMRPIGRIRRAYRWY